MSARTRNYFLDRDLRYLFSYTVELEMKREEIGLVPGGVRINLFGKEGQLYQVLNERAPWAENDVRGTVLPGAVDYAFLGDNDVGHVDIRVSFKTTDGAYIESRYTGVSDLGRGGYREFLREKDFRGEATELLGTADKPFIAKLFVTPTYETSHPRYQWLTKLQCVGFGRIVIIEGMAREATYDIYAMA
jgi:hypothetical protein